MLVDQTAANNTQGEGRAAFVTLGRGHRAP